MWIDTNNCQRGFHTFDRDEEGKIVCRHIEGEPCEVAEYGELSAIHERESPRRICGECGGVNGHAIPFYQSQRERGNAATQITKERRQKWR